MAEPIMSGEIPADGVLEVLREIEERRITGRMRFSAPQEGPHRTGDVSFVAGQIAVDQEPLSDGSDPVECLLALRTGHYAVHLRLPTLPITQGDEARRTGSLAVHVPADLMNYCEASGLTGTLTFSRDGEKVELVYEYGELLAIRVDGRDDGDLSHVFDWTEGSFVLEANAAARTLVPDLAPPVEDPFEDQSAREPTTQFIRHRADSTGRQFLKVLEVALTEIVSQREKQRPPARTSPPREAVQVRARPPTMKPPSTPRRREPTVRVVYLRPDEPRTAVPADKRTRHAARGSAEGALPDAQPARRPSRDRADALEAAKRPEKQSSSPASARAEPAASSAPPSSSPAPAGEAPASGEGPPTSAAEPPPPAPRRATYPGPAPVLWVLAFIALASLLLVVLSRLPRAH